MDNPLQRSVGRVFRQLEQSKRFRRLTARARAVPNTFIIGAPRCGTTALWTYLAKHPCVVPPRAKELFFFGSEPGSTAAFKRGFSWYRSWFPTVLEMDQVSAREGHESQTIEATPFYLYSQKAPQRIFDVRVQAKLIVLLRDPAKRALSDHNFATNKLKIEKSSFEEAIADDEKRAAESFRKAYVSMGYYDQYLRHWMGTFPKEQFLILPAKDLFDHPETAIPRVLDFLELPEADLGQYKQVNGYAYTNRPESETMNKLRRHFKPYNERLFELLGVDYGWNEGLS